MLSLLNKLTLQKDKRNFVTINVLLEKKVKTKENKSNIKTLAVAGN